MPTRRDIPSTSDPAETDELREAFALFSATSEKLSGAYVELQGQVARLSAELATANGELARRERLSALGEMSAKLAHQLRTPLAAAVLYVGQLGGAGIGDAERQRFAAKAMARLQYLERLIADMLIFVKGGQGVISRFPVHELLTDLAQIAEAQAAARGLLFVLEDHSGGTELEADRQAVSGALTSLLENALQASRAGQEVRFAVQADAGPFVAFRVADRGEGIADEGRERLFDPFYTTRPEGSGLGLAIVKQVADSHGGWVEVASAPGEGSVFSLYLPTQAEAP